MNKPRFIAAGAALLIMGGTAGALVHLKQNQHLGAPGLRTSPGKEPGQLHIDLPMEVAGFKTEARPPAPDELAVLPKDTSIGKCLYVAPDGFGSLVNVVMMGGDRTSIHKPEFCLTGQGWQIERAELDAVEIERPHRYALPVMKMTATRLVADAEGKPMKVTGLYVFWFVADGQLTAQHTERMWWMARDLITRGVLQRWAYVSYFTVCRPEQQDAAYERMRGLIAQTVPEFQLAAGPELGFGQ